MTRFGLDSTGEVPVWAHHAAGSTVALRYLSRSSWKVVTRGEYDRAKAAGIDLVLVFEDGGRPDLRGYDGGKADAEFGLKQAHDILGVPKLALCMRLAADYDPAGNAAGTDAYYDGAAAVLTRARCGPYGGNEVIARQADRGFQQLWATYAWSGGRVDPRVLRQGAYQYSNDHTVGGVGVDYNHIYGLDFGQYDRVAPAPADPHHYLRFPQTIVTHNGRRVSERSSVTVYDQLRAHPLLHAPRLHAIRSDLAALATDVYDAAHAGLDSGSFVLPPTWGALHRGWRYQQLIARAHGAKVV